MLAIFSTLMLALIVFARLAESVCNSALPITLPWANNTLSDGIAFNRGLAIELGGQRVSLRASTLFSNTRLRNSRDCSFGNASTISGCQGASGSSFDIQKSSTWVDAPVGDWNVSVVDASRATETVIEGYDTAEFQNGLKINEFPFLVWSDLSSTDKSGLALGQNSSFIDGLFTQSSIPSKVFGLFFGSRSQTKGLDGSLTLGGYDRARVGGPWSNFSTWANYSSVQCPLQVLVKDIRLNNEQGSFSLFADEGAKVVACIDPLQNQFTFTQSMYNIFASVTGHPGDPNIEGGSNFTEQTYPLSASPLLGNLTVELNSGFTTHVPRYEFVSEERGTDLQGKYAVTNSSRLMVAAGTTGTNTLVSEPILILGGVYLSQNYLLVDYDSGTFSLAPAVLGGLDDDAHDIVPVCKEASPTIDAKESSASKLNTGAIAGGVVGGIVLILLVAAGFWIRRRRRSSVPNAGPQPDDSDRDYPEAINPGANAVHDIRPPQHVDRRNTPMLESPGHALPPELSNNR